MPRTKHIFTVLVILAASATGAAILLHEHEAGTTRAWFKKAPAEDNEVFEKILECRKKADFDGAIAVALNGKGKPPDDFLLQALADTYFERAQAEPEKREQWVKLAIQYSEQALETNPDDIVNTFNVGEAYLTAGMNLQKPGSCSYYSQSLEVFDRLKANPILGGKWATIEGERVAMKPYREGLESKAKQARVLASGCPTSADKR